MEDKFGMRGDVTITLRDKDGNVIDVREIRNTIVDAGYDFICDVIGNTTQPNDMAWTGIGTGVTGVLGTDTTLETEVTRVANVYAHSAGTKIFTHTADYAAGTGTGAITESGLLNAASLGTMLNRVVFDVINKGASDTLQVVWTITLS
jgi:hypothetical protein